ncbi:hypothetical protein BDK51DRAFT_27960 [Blyttiomyces helicus]|uniref:Uncharacterized protein n=1 Tax=Blyttiomyces helicus TaxID=388810 RepID=A0A4P9W7M0_9FUNG|nr:hypothetical protein BDK51DRAFT_27960 [Blyttiomyces helicus]|eukprot:RKO86770.1 hypothetical protein BDK51DRAFT_27960 [Blyttiomyces helicus]
MCGYRASIVQGTSNLLFQVVMQSICTAILEEGAKEGQPAHQQNREEQAELLSCFLSVNFPLFLHTEGSTSLLLTSAFLFPSTCFLDLWILPVSLLGKRRNHVDSQKRTCPQLANAPFQRRPPQAEGGHPHQHKPPQGCSQDNALQEGFASRPERIQSLLLDSIHKMNLAHTVGCDDILVQGIGQGSCNLTMSYLDSSLLVRICPTKQVPRLRQAIWSGKWFRVIPKTIPAGDVSSVVADVAALNDATNSVTGDSL